VKEFNHFFSIAAVTTLDRNSNLRPAHCFVVRWAVTKAPLRRMTMLAKALDVVALQFLAVLPLALRCWFSGLHQLVREMNSQLALVTFATAVSAKRAGETSKINNNHDLLRTSQGISPATFALSHFARPAPPCLALPPLALPCLALPHKTRPAAWPP
jgi:hypothetical protein